MVFASIFSYSLFSQIFVESNSILTVTEEAFISSEQSYKAKIYLTTNALVSNLENLSEVEKVFITPETKSKVISKNIAIAGKVNKDTSSKHQRKTTKDNIDVKKKPSIIYFNTENSEAFNSLNTFSLAAFNLSGNSLLAVLKNEDVKTHSIYLLKNDEIQSIEKYFNRNISFSYTVRPPPLSVLI